MFFTVFYISIFEQECGVEEGVLEKVVQRLKSKDKVDSAEEIEAWVSVGARGTENEGIRKPTLRDLAGIIQTLMGQQKVQERPLKEEAARQDHRFKALQHQFQLLPIEVEAHTFTGSHSFHQQCQILLRFLI